MRSFIHTAWSKSQFNFFFGQKKSSHFFCLTPTTFANACLLNALIDTSTKSSTLQTRNHFKTLRTHCTHIAQHTWSGFTCVCKNQLYPTFLPAMPNENNCIPEKSLKFVNRTQAFSFLVTLFSCI